MNFSNLETIEHLYGAFQIQTLFLWGEIPTIYMKYADEWTGFSVQNSA